MNEVLPSVSGVAQVGQTLSSTTGTWSGTAPIALARQWQSCLAGSCLDLVGATGATYVPVVADVGRTLRVRVSASNVAGGPVVADSVQTAAVVAVSPPGAGLVVDASSSAASLGSVSSLSWSHTSSGVDRLLVVAVSHRDNSGASVVGVTYGGQSLTLKGRTRNGSIADSEIWYLVAPPVGAATVTVTLSAARSVVAGAISFAGAHQATPLGEYFGSAGNSSAPSGTVASAVGEIVVNSLSFKWLSGRIATAGAGQTERWSSAASSGATGIIGGASTEPGAASVTMNWAVNAADVWAHSLVTVKPASSGGGALPPVNEVLPSVSGVAQVGQTLSSTTGTWSGTAPIGLARQWQSCLAGSCLDLVGATGATYVPVVADVGRTLRVRVSASNVAGGPVVADSVQTAAVVAVSPPGAGLVVDASSSAASLGSVSSLSWSHTSSGVDRLLVVAVSHRDNSGASVVGVTYGGQSLTLKGRTRNGSIADSEIWYLVAPPVGAATVTVTLSAARSVVAGAISFAGAHQATPLGEYFGSAGNSSAPSGTVASAVGEIVVNSLSFKWLSGRIATAGAGQTERWSSAASSGATGIIGGASTEPGAASVTMNWAVNAADVWAHSLVTVKPA